MSPSMSTRLEPAIRFRLGSPAKKGKPRFAGRGAERFAPKRPESSVSDIEDGVSSLEDDRSQHTLDEDGGVIEAHRPRSNSGASNFSSGSFSSVASGSKPWRKESEKKSFFIEDVLLEMEEENEEDKAHLLLVSSDALPENKGRNTAAKALAKSQESATKKIKRLIELMKDPNNSQSKISYYLSKLRQWTDDEHTQHIYEIAEHGAIQIIIQLMGEQLTNENENHLAIINEEGDSNNYDYALRVQQLGISCLSNLSREASISPTIAAAGGYAVIFAAMKRYPNSANLQEKGLNAIASMARIELNRIELMKNWDPISVIKTAMKNNLDDLYVQRRAFIGLFRLTTEESAAEIGNAGVIEEVIHSMRHHPNDAKLQKLGCGVLKVLARYEEINKAHIVSGRGLYTVLHAMEIHEKDAGVQEEACRLFGHLSSCHCERKYSIARSGALKRILTAMKTHPTSSKVQVAGCVALDNLTTKLEIAQMANSHCALQIVKNAKKECPECAPAIITRLRLARYLPIVFMS